MKRAGLVYGVCGGLLIVVLKLTEYRFLVVEHSVEIYGALVASLFAILGIWLGLTLTRRTSDGAHSEAAVPTAQTTGINAVAAQERGITPRELDVLQLIARGMSTREIAAALFISENTVKTHSSRLFDKLNAKRRTQAVQIGKTLGLIP